MVPSRLAAQAQATVVSQVMATDCDTGTPRRLHDGYVCPVGQQWTERSHRHRLHQAPDHTAAVGDRAHVEHADFTPGKAAFCDFHDAALVAFGTTVTPSSSALTMSPGWTPT